MSATPMTPTPMTPTPMTPMTPMTPGFFTQDNPDTHPEHHSFAAAAVVGLNTPPLRENLMHKFNAVPTGVPPIVTAA